MRIVLVLLFLIKTTGLISQPSSIIVINDDLHVNHYSKHQLNYLPVGEFKTLEWQPGFAYYQDGSLRAYDGIRLNLIEGRAEVNANNQILELLPGVITGFSMGTEAALSHIFVNVPLEDPVFMELLAPGKANFLVLRKEDITLDPEERELTTPITTLRFDNKEEIVYYKEIFYVWYNGMIIQYKPKKKFILQVMADQSNEIQQYLKENKTKLKDPLQMISLFSYYNSFSKPD